MSPPEKQQSLQKMFQLPQGITTFKKIRMQTIGLPVMRFERDEVRAFSPGFVNRFDGVLLEHDYGSGMRYKQSDYNGKFVSREESFAADIVCTTVRCPSMEDLMLLKRGATLFSMLHYPTHDLRNAFLKDRGIRCFSMDSVVDDSGRRLIENLRGTARYGLQEAFRCFFALNPPPSVVRVTVMGSGGVGLMAVDEAIHLSDVPVVVTTIGRGMTKDKARLGDVLANTDILVDATYRQDPSLIIVPRKMVDLMPSGAVICDLAVDPHIRAIEGIPIGDLSQMVFEWDRTVASCYGWPATHPFECMAIYEPQIIPLLQEIAKGGEFDILDQNP